MKFQGCGKPGIACADDGDADVFRKLHLGQDLRRVGFPPERAGLEVLVKNRISHGICKPEI